MTEQDTSMSGQSAYDYQFICQTVGSLYLDWLNTRRQSESIYAPRIEDLQNQVAELIAENEKIKMDLAPSYDTNTNIEEHGEQEAEEEQDEPENG